MTSYIPIPREVDLSLDKKLVISDLNKMEVDIIQMNEKGTIEQTMTFRREDLWVMKVLFGRVLDETDRPPKAGEMG